MAGGTPSTASVRFRCPTGFGQWGRCPSQQVASAPGGVEDEVPIMTKRERVERTMAGPETDQIPLYDLLYNGGNFGHFHRDRLPPRRPLASLLYGSCRTR